MYSLKNNPILLPHQVTILQLFFSTPFAKPFFLTGGTCLSAFYLAHRESQDLDFFSLSPFDSLALRTNIATNKILAVFGRLEPKDYIDLYVIFTQTEMNFDEMFEKAKEKDTGLSELYFANVIADVAQFETFPKMHVPFDKKAFVKFYQDLSRNLLLKIKPV